MNGQDHIRKEGDTYTVPVTFEFNRNSVKTIRRKTEADVKAERALKRGERPTRRAIRMANALYLERLLETGRFSSPYRLAESTGICRDTIYDLLHMLNCSVEEMEAALFETY